MDYEIISMKYEISKNENTIKVNGEVFVAKPSIEPCSCAGCYFDEKTECPMNCSGWSRKDHREIIWKKKGEKK